VPCECEPKITPDDESALESFQINKRAYYASYYNTIYQNDKEHPYVHLMDGGLADNVGLRAIDDLFARGDIRTKISDSAIQRIAVIAVNAKTAKDEDFDQTQSPPGLVTVAMKTATIPMDNYTFETIEKFKNSVEQRIKTESAARKRGGSLAGGEMKLYVIDLGFENLRKAEDRDYFLNLPTSFSLKDDQIDRLIETGGQLLLEHPKFWDFICGFYDDQAERDACIKEGMK
jgi:NTE family protein